MKNQPTASPPARLNKSAVGRVLHAAKPRAPRRRAVSMRDGLPRKHGENTRTERNETAERFFPNLAENPLGVCVESPRGLIPLISGSERVRLLGRGPGWKMRMGSL